VATAAALAARLRAGLRDRQPRVVPGAGPQARLRGTGRRRGLRRVRVRPPRIRCRSARARSSRSATTTA
jgi:hypothetical protein